MTGTTKAQRGPLLSSVVMVMLATAATGLLALIGLQALPDSVVPSTFGGDDHEARSVDVSESPTPATTAKPSAKPSPTATGVAPSARETSTVPNPVRTATTVATTGPTKAPTKTTAPVKKTTSPSPTATKTPSPTATTQAPSPAPSCGTARKPRCPKAAETSAPAFSPSAYTYSSYDAGDPPTYSETQSKHDKPARKAKPAKRSGQGRKR